MSTIYIDSLFLLNLVIDYLLLLSAARLAGEVLCRWRLAAGAVLGAVYAAAVFFPGMVFLSHPLCKLAAAIGMLLCAFGGSRHLLRLSIVFFCVSAAFGGGIFAIQLLGGRSLSLQNGIFYSAMDLRLILLSAALCYVVITLVFNRSACHVLPQRELAPVVVRLGERQITLTALLDTGNTLTDPITNRPVLVVEGERLSALFDPGQGPGTEELEDPARALEHLAERSGYTWQLLPYQAVGVQCGLLLALRTDGVEVSGKDYGKILAALVPGRVSDGGGYNALIAP